MKILVTGGAGFIGSAVIRHIINSTSCEVLNIDKLTYAGNLDSLTSVAEHKRYKFKNLDICNKEGLEDIFNSYKPNKVMHLAAETHVDRSIGDSRIFIETNVIGTYNLLEVSKDYWANLDSKAKREFRFHHVSTDEVYGDLADDNSFLQKVLLTIRVLLTRLQKQVQII